MAENTESSSAKPVVAVFSLSTDDDFSASVKDDDIPKPWSDVKELSEQKEQLTAKVSTGLQEVEDDLFIDLPGKRGEGKAKRFWTELRTKSALTFTLAAALILLTHINLVVFIVTQVNVFVTPINFDVRRQHSCLLNRVNKCRNNYMLMNVFYLNVAD